MPGDAPPESLDILESIRQSSLATEPEQGALMSSESARRWLDVQAQKRPLRTSRIAFKDLREWRFSQTSALRLVHRTGRFFEVQGRQIHCPRSNRQWAQPLLNQPEVGLLGLLATEVNGVAHFLAQSKWEPGARTPQLSPTVQATFSNYSRAHGGRSQPYLSFFTNAMHPPVIDAIMPEYGDYFLAKYNRNVVLWVPSDVTVEPSFCWLTLGQLRHLAAAHDLLHMDTRSVVACLPRSDDDVPFERNSHVLTRGVTTAPLQRSDRTADLIEWLHETATSHRLQVTEVGIDRMAGWALEEDELRPLSPKPPQLSIVAVRVTATGREVAHWRQPLIALRHHTVVTLCCRRTLAGIEFLVQARVQPGISQTALVFPTWTGRNADEEWPSWLSSREQPARVLLDTWASEEGGRFYDSRSRLLLLDAPTHQTLPNSSLYRWVSFRDLRELGLLGHLSLELRSILASLGDINGSS